MKSLHLLILSSILFFSACDEHQQTTCVESDKFVMRGDTCLIVDGDTIHKPTTVDPSYKYHLYLDKYHCCLNQIRSLSLDKKYVPQASLNRLIEFKNLQFLALVGYDSLPKEIGQLTQLKSLRIVNYEGTIFIPNTIQDLHNLTQVDVLANKFPFNIMEIPHLTDLRTNGIHSQEYFPNDISALKKIKKLDVGYSTVFSKQITQLKNLTHLKFRSHANKKNDSIFVIPTEINKLQNLEYFDLTSHELDTLPESIGQLTNLKELHLPYLKKAPTSLTKLKKLRSLKITRNQQFPMKGLARLLSKINSLESITYHQEDNMDLEKLSKALQNLPSLSLFDIRGNFAMLPHQIFNKNLRELTIQAPTITTLPNGIFELKQLNKLSINLTKISGIPPEIQNLTALKSLNLSYNRIRQLPPEIGYLKNLVTFKIWHNQLTSLPNEIQHLKKLEYLDISYNKLDYEGILSNLKQRLPQLEVNIKQ